MTHQAGLSRRAFLAGSALLLAGCGRDRPEPSASNFTPAPDNTISSLLPAQVFGGYWRADIGLSSRDTPAAYNLIYLFHAVPDGASGSMRLPREVPRDVAAQVAALREQRRVVLTMGGANAAVQFSRRSASERFVRSVRELVDDIGPVDGVDLNTYEDGTPNIEEYIWLAGELKDEFGADFMVTTPPAPWSKADLELCGAMAEAGVVDLVSPQFYDGPGLAEQRALDQYRARWTAAVGASRLGQGLGLGNEQNYMTAQECFAAWQSVQETGLRGTYLWSLERDRATGWAFTDLVAR